MRQGGGNNAFWFCRNMGPWDLQVEMSVPVGYRNQDFGRSEVWRYRFRSLRLLAEAAGVYEITQEHCGEHAQP